MTENMKSVIWPNCPYCGLDAVDDIDDAREGDPTLAECQGCGREYGYVIWRVYDILTADEYYARVLATIDGLIDVASPEMKEQYKAAREEALAHWSGSKQKASIALSGLKAALIADAGKMEGEDESR